MTTLPNPTKYDEGSFKTLRETLGITKDVSTYQRNTDINTFKAHIESKEGFEKAFERIHEVTVSNENLGKQGKIFHKKTEDGRDEESKTLHEGLHKAFRAFVKPFTKAMGNLNDKAFGDFGDMWSAGSERFGSGLKELTNGIGALGPIINQFKTGIHKAMAVWNMFIGFWQMAFGLFGRLFKAVKSWWSGDTEQASAQLAGEDTEAGIQRAIAKLDEDRAQATSGEQTSDEKQASGTEEGKPIWVKLHPQSIADMGGDKSGDSVKAWQKEQQIKKHISQDEQEAIEEKGRLDLRARAEESQYQKKKAILETKLKKEQQKKELAMYAKGQAKRFGIWLLKMIIPLGLMIWGFAKMFEKWDSWDDTPFTGIANAASNAGTALKEAAIRMKDSTSGFFKKMGDSLGKTRLGKWLGLGADAAGDATKEVVKNVVKEGADDVGKEALKRGAGETFKKVASQGVRRIPVAGAVAETAIDYGVNQKKFNRIKAAYESGAKFVKDEETGEMRAMTEEEFINAQKANRTNVAGSVGRGAGALGGAAMGAAIGSVIPGVGTVIGGVVGGILGGFFGGRAGDDIATHLAGKASGISDAQGLIDMYAGNLPELVEEKGDDLKLANQDALDLKEVASDSTGGSSSSTLIADSSQKTDITYASDGDMDDKQLSYSGEPAG